MQLSTRVLTSDAAELEYDYAATLVACGTPAEKVRMILLRHGVDVETATRMLDSLAGLRVETATTARAKSILRTAAWIAGGLMLLLLL